MLNADQFLQVISDNQGFEVTLGFANDVDHIIGGSGHKIWYVVKKGSSLDYCIGTQSGGSWNDVHYVRKKGALSSEPADPGATLSLILPELSAGQQEVEASGYKPFKKEVCGHPCGHYSFSFGERAYVISDEYGITVERSDINDQKSGFRLRYIETGKKVKVPKEA